MSGNTSVTIKNTANVFESEPTTSCATTTWCLMGKQMGQHAIEESVAKNEINGTDMDKIELEIKLVVLSNRRAKTQSDKHHEVAYSQMELSEMGKWNCAIGSASSTVDDARAKARAWARARESGQSDEAPTLSTRPRLQQAEIQLKHILIDEEHLTLCVRDGIDCIASHHHLIRRFQEKDELIPEMEGNMTTWTRGSRTLRRRSRSLSATTSRSASWAIPGVAPPAQLHRGARD